LCDDKLQKSRLLFSGCVQNVQRKATRSQLGQITNRKDDGMVHWAWVLVAAFGGTVFGMFLFAFLEVSREEEKKKGGVK